MTTGATMPDLTDYTDDDLATLRLAVLTEQERRQRIESIPGQIATLKQEYLDAGGDPDNLPDETPNVRA